MFPTANYPIRASRYTPHSDYVTVIGYDFTGAVAKMQVRDRKNGGSIQADIVPTVTVTTVSGVVQSKIEWTIGESTMEAMISDSGSPEADVKLYYDVHLTPSGGDKFVLVEGKFTVVAGVTQ